MFKTVACTVEQNLLRAGHEGSTIFNSVLYQCVRWRRKPRWLPTAKSKVFKIPVRVKIPEEERIELKRLNDNYNTEMKSIRSFFAGKIKQMTTAPNIIAEHKRIEDEDHHNCLRLNDEWNANVAKIREARINAQKMKEQEAILLKVEENRRLMAERKELIENLVRQEKEKSKSFITAENVDIAIDQALSGTQDYDFSIDLQGNIFKGRLTKIESQDSKQGTEEKLQVSQS